MHEHEEAQHSKAEKNLRVFQRISKQCALCLCWVVKHEQKL